MQMTPEMQHLVSTLTRQVPNSTIEDAMMALQVAEGFSDGDPLEVLQNMTSQKSGSGMADHAVSGMGNPQGAEKFGADRLRDLMAQSEYDAMVRRRGPEPKMTPELSSAIGDVNVLPDLGMTSSPEMTPELSAIISAGLSPKMTPELSSAIGDVNVLPDIGSMQPARPPAPAPSPDPYATDTYFAFPSEQPSGVDHAGYRREPQNSWPTLYDADYSGASNAGIEDRQAEDFSFYKQSPYSGFGNPDMSGIPNDISSEAPAVVDPLDELITNLQTEDGEAGGATTGVGGGRTETVSAQDSGLPSEYGGPFAGARQGLLGMLGMGDDSDASDRLGMALVKGGAALASGSADFGTALGQAITVGADAHLAERSDQDDRTNEEFRRLMAERRYGLEEEAHRVRMDAAQEAMKRSRRGAANDRITEAHDLMGQGYTLDENGTITGYNQPSVPLPDELKTFTAVEQWALQTGDYTPDEARNLAERAAGWREKSENPLEMTPQ